MHFSGLLVNGTANPQRVKPRQTGNPAEAWQHPRSGESRRSTVQQNCMVSLSMSDSADRSLQRTPLRFL